VPFSVVAEFDVQETHSSRRVIAKKEDSRCMSGPTTPASDLLSSERPKKRRLRDVPAWVPIVIVIVASPLITLGAFAVADYIVEHTTVTVDSATWAIPVGGGTEYIISCGPGWSSCPQHVKPGSDYMTSIFVSGYFAGKNVTLSAPSPFRLLSTDPSLPVLVPPSGLVITMDLGLPSSPGEYTFLGTVTFITAV
jgi:hypothetical protein